MELQIMKKKNVLGQYEFGIYEVYYDESGKTNGWTEHSLIPVCSSVEDLYHELNFMIKAFEKETLEYNEKYTSSKQNWL